MARRNSRKRLIAEINVVPYIDVMLVLLVIFMITAPLLNQGVEIDLPQTNAEQLPPHEQEPLLLSVDRNGSYYINIAEHPSQPLDPDSIFDLTRSLLLNNPQLPVLVKADENVDYGTVVYAMVLLQRAGATKVGLLTETSEQ
jgi:biopolymer transport protein TolR